MGMAWEGWAIRRLSLSSRSLFLVSASRSSSRRRAMCSSSLRPSTTWESEARQRCLVSIMKEEEEDSCISSLVVLANLSLGGGSLSALMSMTLVLSGLRSSARREDSGGEPTEESPLPKLGLAGLTSSGT